MKFQFFFLLDGFLCDYFEDEMRQCIESVQNEISIKNVGFYYQIVEFKIEFWVILNYSKEG